MGLEATTLKYRDYEPLKELSQQIAMTKSDLSELQKVSPFDDDRLGIINIFDCQAIKTDRGIFSFMLYATPLMEGPRAWVKHEIHFKAEQIFDTTFDQKLLNITYSIDKANAVFKQHFVSLT
ncbi:MAG: hypothetical protein H0X29_04970 [Parachlamydiaceae bacterium]|nr:hypothetical protein [Parachlamydiaceae bacterium]